MWQLWAGRLCILGLHFIYYCSAGVTGRLWLHANTCIHACYHVSWNSDFLARHNISRFWWHLSPTYKLFFLIVRLGIRMIISYHRRVISKVKGKVTRVCSISWARSFIVLWTISWGLFFRPLMLCKLSFLWTKTFLIHVGTIARQGTPSWLLSFLGRGAASESWFFHTLVLISIYSLLVAVHISQLLIKF